MIVIMPMTRMIKKTTAACMALLAMGTAAQAQVPGSALNYMLQKPRTSWTTCSSTPAGASTS